MQRTIYLFALVMLGLFVIGCASKNEIPFAVIGEGYKASDYPVQQGMVISSPGEWEHTWKQLNFYTIPQPELPEVDFTQHLILVVFAGEQRSGGYAIEIKRIIQTDQEVIVYATKTAPKSGQMNITQITYPYQIVKIPHIALPVRFEF